MRQKWRAKDIPPLAILFFYSRNPRADFLLKKLPHIIDRARCARIARHAQPLQHQSKRVLMLVERRRFISHLRELRTDRNPRHAPAAMRVVIRGLVKKNDQQSAILEGAAGD